MDGRTDNPIIGDEGSNYTGTNQPVNGTGTRKPGTRKSSTRKPRSPKQTGQDPQDILDPSTPIPDNGKVKSEHAAAPFLSEDEINLLLTDQPGADETPIPQPVNLGDLTTASIILSLIDGMVQMVLGPDCAMTKDERKMMQEPLDRIMARFPVAQIAAIGPYVDPLLLLMGVIAWGSRIARLKDTQKLAPKTAPAPAPAPAKPKPAPQPEPPQNNPVPYVPELMTVPGTLGIRIGE